MRAVAYARSGGQLDHSAVTREDRYSLTDADLHTIRVVLPRLPGRWLMLTESGEEGEVYTCLMPPWSDGQRSAFLLEREHETIIMTDNLSELDCCPTTGFSSIAAAMEAVQRIVLGEIRERSADPGLAALAGRG